MLLFAVRGWLVVILYGLISHPGLLVFAQKYLISDFIPISG
jgi:hypothetical protein